MQYRSRVDLIVIGIFAVACIVVPIVVVLRHFYSLDPLFLLHITWGRTVIGIIFTLLATVVCLWNFYLTIIGPWLHRRQGGSMKDYGGPSGLPVLGGVFIFCAGTLMPPSVPLGIYLLALYLVDTNGLPWFFFLMLRE